MIYVCKICGYEYNEDAEGVAFKDLPADWTCPICAVGKELFEPKAATPQKAHKASNITASEALAEALAACGLKWVFGMVGHSNLGLADAVRRMAISGKLRFIGIRHEGAASFAAAAYGKLTGKPAACLTIAGPGSTNLITGLFDAKLDRAPAIAITGQIPAAELGTYAFQEIDLRRAFGSLADSQFTVYDKSDFAGIAQKAYENAVIRRGVSQIIFPDDIQLVEASGGGAAHIPRPVHKKSAPALEDVEAAAKMISESLRPVIIAGEGARACPDKLKALVEELGCPLLFTYKTKGLIEESYKYSCGVIGRSGTPASARLLEKSDCVLGIGMGFSKHTGIPKGKAVIQIDADPAALGRLYPVKLAMLGDAGEAVTLLLKALKKSELKCKDAADEIAAEMSAWKKEKEVRASKSREGALAPAQICLALSKTVPEDAIISIDVGNVAYSFGRYFEAKRQRMLLSWYLGSIGVGLPAAIGAWCAAQDEPDLKGRAIWAVVGDGGLGQYLAEWTTAVKYGMKIKLIVFNNSELAKISREQENEKMEIWQTSLLNPDFAAYSKSCGAYGARVSKPEELEKILKEAAAYDGPALVDVLTNPDLS